MGSFTKKTKKENGLRSLLEKAERYTSEDKVGLRGFDVEFLPQRSIFVSCNYLENVKCCTYMK